MKKEQRKASKPENVNNIDNPASNSEKSKLKMEGSNKHSAVLEVLWK